ncbi:MAG: serine hydrolase [Bacteroidaceae bacterium]|nr:serine hydrolase [Bacteroidaceae bacterium]
MKKLIALLALLTCWCWNLNTEAGFRPMPQEIETKVKPIIGNSVAGNEACRQWVEEQMSRLSLEEKVGQLMVYKLTPELTKANRNLLNSLVKNYHIGGLLFSGGKLQGQASVINLAQELTDIPMMITCDGEWGLGMRMTDAVSYPRNRVLGCIQEDSLIYAYGLESARQMRELGITVNFAPVADVDNNPNNPVINTRSFGEDPANVARKVIAYMQGLQAGGVVAVAKHFPGHGDTDVDSHKALPTLNFTRARMDSIELYPFKQAINAGVDGIMVGHLDVPQLSERSGLPSSLSHNIVTDLLQEELGFEGLIFTDALEMKGVASAEGTTCLQALKAGADLLLVPMGIRGEFRALVQAVKKGQVSEELVDAKCRKILTYKYALGLHEKPHVQISGLSERVNDARAKEMLQTLNKAAVTVLGNAPAVLPFDTIAHKIAVLNVGGNTQALSPLVNQLKNYGSPEVINLPAGQSAAQYKALQERLEGYQRVLACVMTQNASGYKNFFANYQHKVPVVTAFFTVGKGMEQLPDAVHTSNAVVLAHIADAAVQAHVADILYGKAAATGRLSTSIGTLFLVNAGVDVAPAKEAEVVLADYQVNEKLLAKVDEIALEGIKEQAYPGCQIVVLKNGREIYNKVFGTRTYDGKDVGSTPGHPIAVRPTDVYDLASLTKTTATLLAVMKLYDEQRINLSDPLSKFLPYLKGTNKQNIVLRSLLFHEAGLPSGLSFYRLAIDDDSYSGQILSNKKDRRHPVQYDARTWVNPNFKFKKGLTSTTKTDTHTLQVAENLWLDEAFRTEAYQQRIIEANLLSRTYRYSDISFILLQQVVEAVTGMRLDAYLEQEFYGPMGLKRTLFLPLNRIPKEEIAPTEEDGFVRKQLLQGYVHDESAAFQGGVSGNAGLFSTAEEVAQIYQMLLNGGEYHGKRYLSESTVRLFTTTTSKISHRGLGFDKPNVKDLDKSNCGEMAPASVYGHTGFTGTSAWVDPDHQMVYVFISNRVYPHRWPNKLSTLNIRTRIQDQLYEAIK